MNVPRYWRSERTRYGLVGEICRSCGKPIFPPRDVCPHCTDEGQDVHPFGGKGQVYSFSTVYDAPAGYTEYQPYTVALIKLDEGPLVTAQLTDVDNEAVHIGMPVEMVTRKIKEEGENGLIIYGYKFRPVLESKSSRPDRF
ncbi:MAG: Zn-ribbon domain-containing OB-fold protein [Chloroflexi bacterium]|nr:Zn-ribbon domain-containing OB-fold protein [Chloroflexota bacterium]